MQLMHCGGIRTLASPLFSFPAQKRSTPQKQHVASRSTVKASLITPMPLGYLSRANNMRARGDELHLALP